MKAETINGHTITRENVWPGVVIMWLWDTRRNENGGVIYGGVGIHVERVNGGWANDSPIERNWQGRPIPVVKATSAIKVARKLAELNIFSHTQEVQA